MEGKKYTAPHILIATGGRPAVPSDSEIPGEPDEIPQLPAWREAHPAKAKQAVGEEVAQVKGAKGSLLCRCQPGDDQ